jgi:cytochrome c oxidase cbb3-type subunit I
MRPVRYLASQEVLRAQMARRSRPHAEPPRRRPPLIPDGTDSAAIGALVFAALWLVTAISIGLVRVGLQLASVGVELELPLGLIFTVDLLRVESAFVVALVLGWLTNAGLGAIFFVTSRLVGQPLALPRLAMIGVLAWNLLVVAPALGALYLGLSTPGRLTELPLPIGGAALLALGLANVSFWLTVLPPRGGLPYISLSLAYFGIALLALTGLLALGTLTAFLRFEDPVDGLIDPVLAIAIERYWLLGTAVGTLYYVIPRVSGNPLHSSGLALLGFAIWLPMAGASAAAALLTPAVAYVITTLGITASMLLVAHAFVVVANLVLTMSGRWRLVLGSGAVPMAIVSLSCLLVIPVLQAVGSLRAIQVAFGLTDWTMGVFLLATLGTYTFAFFALAEHAMPRLLRRSWRAGILSSAQLWLTFAGVVLAGFAMMSAGLVDPAALAATPPEEIGLGILALRLAAFGGIGLAALGALALLVNWFLMYTSGRPHPGIAEMAAAGH